MAPVHRLTIQGHHTTTAQLIYLRGQLDDEARGRLSARLADPLLETISWDTAPADSTDILLHPGVTDAAAGAVHTALALLGLPSMDVATGRQVQGPTAVGNPVIERWGPSPQPPAFAPTEAGSGRAETIAITTLDEAGLADLNVSRGMYLDPAELLAVQQHFRDEGREPTDVELEMLAQTWSEHCAHKTFRAAITATDATGHVRDVLPLMQQLRGCTDRIAAPFVRSAFAGNAGIISFADGISLAVKAETHNHPSAIEPFGGANTGVGGVIRDILGTGHVPVACTDILCFGPPDTDPSSVPAGALHPADIREGVVAGVADYGNKIGLPTVAGAVLYDPAYTTNPLVFCGCIGVGDDAPLPTAPQPGDRVIVLGGRTGRDGIRGATFSSATMDAATGEVAGASVQIGDPIVEKLLIDVIAGARHLYRGITDCGAGGLSSAVGEMAEGVGADVELDLVPLKYPGLEPWEIWLSEAQERMVLAVPPASVEQLRVRCAGYGVELSDIGEFTGTGRMVVRSDGQPVADLATDFLHDGRPQRLMTAELPVAPTLPTSRIVADVGGALLALLAHRNIASKETVIRRYDHEIRGATVGRPLVGVAADAPGDGTVLVEPGSEAGYAIGIGVNPWYGVHDPQAMAWAVVDEAIRNVVAVGADPMRVALLDNFSWGDPRRPSTLGALVAAVEGCCAAATAFGAPYVSGKDSLNNEYVGSDGQRHAVPPTLVITAIADVPDAAAVLSSDLSAPGNLLVLVGRTRVEFAGSHLDMVSSDGLTVTGIGTGITPQPDVDAPRRYGQLHDAMRAGLIRSCHDISEGGLAVALAEMCIGGRLGAHIGTLGHADLAVGLFAESLGRFVCEVAPNDLDRLAAEVDDVTLIGRVTVEPQLVLPDGTSIGVDTLRAAFTREGLPA